MSVSYLIQSMKQYINLETVSVNVEECLNNTLPLFENKIQNYFGVVK